MEKAGGLHRFMAWEGPILTDSGGFQVFSLPNKRITDDGAYFKHEITGEEVFLDPAKAIAIQEALGSDIIMAFDECIPYRATSGMLTNRPGKPLDGRRHVKKPRRERTRPCSA